MGKNDTFNVRFKIGEAVGSNKFLLPVVISFLILPAKGDRSQVNAAWRCRFFSSSSLQRDTQSHGRY